MKRHFLLAVDDKPDNLYVLRSLIAQHLPELQVLVALTAEEGLAIAAQTDLDGILADVQMPGMSGIEMCRQLKASEKTAHVPLILVTAHRTSSKIKEEGLEAGADDFLTKPIDNTELVAKIRVMLRIKRAQDELRDANIHLDQLVAEKTLEVRAERDKLLSAFTSMEDGIAIIDHEGNVKFANASLIAEFGSPAGRKCYTYLYHRDHPCPECRNQEVWAGQTVQWEWTSPSNGKVYSRFDIPMKNADRSISKLTIFRDISERVRAEDERKAMEAHLRQRQKLESIGTLASGVAHEINNPLMGMMNYAELVKDTVQDPKAVGYLTEIGNEGNRIAKIVHNLLSFSRQGGEKYGPAKIADIVDNSLSLVGALLRKDQISLELDIPEDLSQIECRSQQIQQVIINLLTNAHDALNARYPAYDVNKIIRVTAHPFEKDGEEWIRTTVEDHGIGIQEEITQRIFDPFFTTKSRHEGTGLGLSISFGIVSEHKGELTVESTAGESTRFHMDLRVNNRGTHEANQEETA